MINDPATAVREALAKIRALTPLLRMLTIRDVLAAGEDVIAASGINPWCVAEGRASGDEPALSSWQLDEIKSVSVTVDALLAERDALAAEVARLREALKISQAPKCFSCGRSVTQHCPRPHDAACGREHLGGARAALEPRT